MLADWPKYGVVNTGSEADRSTVDYSLAGTTAAKIFNAMAALGIIAFTFGASQTLVQMKHAEG